MPVKPNAGKTGCMIDAAVMIATVEDPCAVFSKKVRRKGNNNPGLPEQLSIDH